MRLNDKHVEVIVRQIMRKVTIIEPGDTKFLEGDVEEKIDFTEENEAIYEEKFLEDAGEWEKFKPGMIVTLREIREENSLSLSSVNLFVRTDPKAFKLGKPFEGGSSLGGKLENSP